MISRTLAIAFLTSLLCMPSGFAESAPPASHETLLVMNRPGSDAGEFAAKLEQRGLTVLREARCKTYGYSVFDVLPASGDAHAALHDIKASKDADLAAAEIKFKSEFQGCVPDINDPDFDLQWHLDAMNFDEMQCLLDAHGVAQSVRPRITLIDSGIVAINKELPASQIREFNFVGGVNGVEDDVLIDGHPSSHGTGVTSVAACTTNNAKFLASPASRDKSPMITMCRVTETGAIDTMDAIDAMIWCVDNQAIRGGRGVINLSINALPPATYNSSSVVQDIAKSAARQGDLFVNGAGNTNELDPSEATKKFRVIVGLDETAMRWDESPTLGSVFGDFKAAAPCTDIPYLVGSAKAEILSNSGTSLAAPCWSSCIALLMSLDPTLTAPKADRIVFKTGTKTDDGYRMPNLHKAVNKVLELEP